MKINIFDIFPAFYNKKTVKNALVNNKIDKIEPNNKSGGNQASCQDCPAIYLGQTGRKFITRFSEHLRAIDNSKVEHSNIAKHMLDNNHKISIDNFKILHQHHKSFKLTLLEFREFSLAHNRGTPLINDQLEL